MGTAPLRVLLIEDNPGDARLVFEFLNDENLRIHHEDHLAAGIAYLAEHEVDVILLDLGLPDSQGLDTVSRVVERDSGAPVIVLTGLDDEETGISAVRAGAEDYLSKGKWEHQVLSRAIRYAMERSENQSRLRHLNQVLKAIRGVNQLIVRERDPRRLIQRCCEELTQSGGFDLAMICLVDDTSRVTLSMSSKRGKDKAGLDHDNMDPPPLCIDVLGHEGVLSGKELEHYCTDCIYSDYYSGWMKIVTRLECQGRVYGFLRVLNSTSAEASPGELELIQELADDMALALRGIEEQRRRENAEALLTVRLKLLEFAVQHDLGDVLRKTLEEVETLTGSQVSFFYFLENDQQTISLRAWSNATKEDFCRMSDPGKHHNLESAGVWAECIRKRKTVVHNDYASLPHKRGLPPGHFELIREMVTPILRNEKIVAILGVGNKPDVYSEEDKKSLELIADVAWEIVSRKKMETELHRTENRYRKLFESSKDGILIIDAETGNIIDVNPVLAQLLGYSHEALMGKKIWEVEVFTPIVPSREVFSQGMNNDLFRVNEFSLKTTDGRSVYVEFDGNAFDVDDQRVIHCSVRDVSDRKRSEAERERLLSAIEQAGEMIVITDPQGIIQYVNPSFTRTTGYPDRESIGQKISILKSGKQNRSFYRDLWETIMAGKTWNGRMVNMRKDGTFFTEETTISPVIGHDGQIVSFVAVKHDITEHLQLESQFRQAQKMESVGRLAGGVAHDYNNMLTVIIGNTEMAMDEMDAEDPLYEYLEDIRNAGRRSAEITRQLLAFASKQTIVPRVLDLNETVDGMLKMLRRLIGENISLAWLPGTGLGSVNMDPTQLDQILANLCVNSRDAITGVGKIEIETGMQTFLEEDVLPGTDEKSGDFIFLSVTDDGCGMDQDTIENIFEPFFTTKDIGKGTGLGLSTVYGIVKQNNGFLKVSSEPGKGTTFKIYLPLHRAETCDRRDDGFLLQLQIKKGRGETILIVEDEIPVLNLIKSILTKLGYSILTASKPKEALRLVQTHCGQIQLLVTDVVMPEMNGLDLAQELLKSCPDMKILFMSGYTSDIIAHQCILDEGVHFIPKPFSRKTLSDKIREVLMIDS